MRLPHTLLMVLAAAVLWGVSRYAAPPPPKTMEEVPALAIPGSAFGSLIARTMRESLYAYWHGGESYRVVAANTANQAPPVTSAPPPPPPPVPGVFSKRRLGPAGEPPAAPAPTEHAHAPAPEPEFPTVGTPVDRIAGWLNQLEARRTRRTGSAALSVAHRRYINASAGWRLRLAYNLDPGDPVLYEILYHYITTTSDNLAQIQKRSQVVTEKALAHAKSNQGGMVNAQTGVGAAINALNELMLLRQPGFPSKEEIAPRWEDVISCQQQFREIRAAAERDGWWQNIPPLRRLEIDDHARYLDRLVAKFRENLAAKGYVVSHQ